MRQNAVARRPPQQNELISPCFQRAFFVHLGKGNDRVVAKDSIEGRRLTTSPGLRSIPEPMVFPIRTRVLRAKVEKRLLLCTPNVTSKVDRALRAIADDANQGV